MSVETLLYQAGYRAALEERDALDQRQLCPGEKTSRSRRLPDWIPMIAASVMTALLTIPLGYQMGGRFANRADNQIAEQHESLAIPAERPRAERSDAPAASPAKQHDPPIAPESTVRPIPIVSLASILQPVWTLPEPSTETLTAFSIPSLDSLPRSGWIAMEDESMVPQQTMSAGDLGKFTIGLQVNPR
jgi:hypothetical protein